MTKHNAQQPEFVQQLEDILLRYELDTPISAEQLLLDLEILDNPYEVIRYFDSMHAWIAEHYGDEIARSVMPEISKVHAQISRPALGGLTFAQLQTVLDDMQVATEMPQDQLGACHARIDMATFLTYIRDNKPLLTKTWRQINRKSVSEINALMNEPQQAVHDYGKVVFTDRDEREFWHISFLRAFAQSEHMVYVRNNRLNLSKRGAGWLELDATVKTEALFRSWCEVADWSFWTDRFYDVADALYAEQHMLYQAILALNKYHGNFSEQSLDDVCAALCGFSNEPNEYGHRPFSHVSYCLLIRPLVYFGFASYKQSQKDFISKSDFTLTNLGQWMLKKAMRDQWQRSN